MLMKLTPVGFYPFTFISHFRKKNLTPLKNFQFLLSVYRGLTENVIQPFCQERFQDWAKAKNLDELANLVTIL